MPLLVVADAVEKRQCERASSDRFGYGEVSIGGAGMSAPCWLQVDWGEIPPRGDAAGREPSLDEVAVDFPRQANDIDEPAKVSQRECEGGEFETRYRDLCEEIVVTYGGGTAKFKNLRNAGELRASQGAGQIREPVVVAVLGMVQPV